MSVEIDCSYDEMLPIAKAKPHPKNNNRHPKEQIERLAKIIEYQGFRSSIVISKLSGFIVKGHGRLLAAKKLGMKKVPVNYQSYEDESQEYADLTADNEVARWAELDLESLLENADLLHGLPDLDLLGIEDFELPDIDIIIQEKKEHKDMIVKNEDSGIEDDIPDVPEIPKTKRGDIWILGKHRVMCGDSTEIKDVKSLMDGNKVDMVFTDPPYGYKYESNHQSSHKMLKNDDVILNFMPVSNLFMKDNSCIYVCTAHQSVEKWIPLIRSTFKYKNMIVWQKNNWSMGDLTGSFAGQHELILFASKGICKIIGGRSSDVWKFNRAPPSLHPTMKPIDLIEFSMSKFKSKEVADFFGGSGSTLISCEKTGRVNYTMELDEKYCDVIIKRWQQYTGKQAILERTGEKYNEIK